MQQDRPRNGSKKLGFFCSSEGRARVETGANPCNDSASAVYKRANLKADHPEIRVVRQCDLTL
jgi:hypothetical protein